MPFLGVLGGTACFQLAARQAARGRRNLWQLIASVASSVAGGVSKCTRTGISPASVGVRPGSSGYPSRQVGGGDLVRGGRSCLLLTHYAHSSPTNEQGLREPVQNGRGLRDALREREPCAAPAGNGNGNATLLVSWIRANAHDEDVLLPSGVWVETWVNTHGGQYGVTNTGSLHLRSTEQLTAPRRRKSAARL
eukprot:gene13653-biopygen3529